MKQQIFYFKSKTKKNMHFRNSFSFGISSMVKIFMFLAMAQICFTATKTGPTTTSKTTPKPAITTTPIPPLKEIWSHLRFAAARVDMLDDDVKKLELALPKLKHNLTEMQKLLNISYNTTKNLTSLEERAANISKTLLENTPEMKQLSHALESIRVDLNATRNSTMVAIEELKKKDLVQNASLTKLSLAVTNLERKNAETIANYTRNLEKQQKEIEKLENRFTTTTTTTTSTEPTPKDGAGGIPVSSLGLIIFSLAAYFISK